MIASLFFAVIIFVFGLVMGSFSNVAIHRVPQKLSLIHPPSFCPRCEAPIRWHDNVPLISYLWLKGRCRNCQAPISPRYPLVEAATGALYLCAFWKVGWHWNAFLPLYWFFISVTLTVGVIDLDKMIIPNLIILPATLLSLTAVGIIAWIRWDLSVLTDSLLGLAVGGLPLGLLAFLFPAGMGMGDAKLAAFIGVVLGYYVVMALFIGFFLGGVMALVLLALGRKKGKDPITLGPFLVAGGWISLLLGPQLLHLYRSIFGGG